MKSDDFSHQSTWCEKSPNQVVPALVGIGHPMSPRLFFFPAGRVLDLPACWECGSVITITGEDPFGQTFPQIRLCLEQSGHAWKLYSQAVFSPMTMGRSKMIDPSLVFLEKDSDSCFEPLLGSISVIICFGCHFPGLTSFHWVQSSYLFSRRSLGWDRKPWVVPGPR